jgi:nucleoside-diphosphate-sugar epimerase
VPERLHAAPVLVNAYQLTKWGAEEMLATEHARGGVPVTLVRTTGVTGHAESGWFKSRFGLYLFFDLVAQARAAGSGALTLALADGARPNLVPIDFVVEVARRLGARASDDGGFEISHCAGRARLTTHQILVAAGAALGVAVRFGAPATALDRGLDQALAPVRPFVEIHWDWETSALERALPGLVIPTVDAARLERLLQAYVATLRA